MAWTRTLPCSVKGCGEPSQHHHAGKHRGTGIKCSDFEGIPLCYPHHKGNTDCIHNGVETFERKFGLDIQQLIIECLTKYIQEETDG